MLMELILIAVCCGAMLVAMFCSFGWMFARSDARLARAESVRQEKRIARLDARIETLERRLAARQNSRGMPDSMPFMSS
ncbi:hypothetical protein QFZ21_002444 [Microbacterium sp. W4I20]|nr:hypothetical protein [Microbacterium sp. W4I20]